MNILLRLCAVGALVFAGLLVEARAGGCTWGVLTTGSHHFDKGREKDYEQQNWGLGLEHCLGREDLRAFGGWYRNSQRRDSTYFGVAWTPFCLGPVCAGAAAARVSGYGEVVIREERGADGTSRRTAEVNDEPVSGVFPVAVVESGHVGLNLMFVKADKVSVLAWALKWRFD